MTRVRLAFRPWEDFGDQHDPLHGDSYSIEDWLQAVSNDDLSAQVKHMHTLSGAHDYGALYAYIRATFGTYALLAFLDLQLRQ